MFLKVKLVEYAFDSISTYLIKRPGRLFDFFNQKMMLKGFQNNI